MILAKYSLALALSGAMALAACTDTSSYTSDPNQRTKQGAAIGAISGAIFGAATGTNSKQRNHQALFGALVGAAAGGLIGQNLDKQARGLEQSFGNSQIRVQNTGSQLIVTMPQDILFATNSDTVNPSLQGDLRVLADSLNQFPKSSVQVVGHTDNTGPSGYNQGLSVRRANSVVSVLIRSGVSPSRLVAIGRGEDQPIASNLIPEGRAQNRRVEIVITPYQ